MQGKDATSPNTAYTLRAYALALRDIAPFGRNVVYMVGTLGETVLEGEENETRVFGKRI